MTKTRLVITAIVLVHRPVAHVAAEYGVSRSWAYRLLAPYREEGESAFDPRTRRPHGNPHATAPTVIKAIIATRHRLAGQSHEAGAHTIAWRLATHHHTTVAPATIWRS
jgi:transposase